MKLVKLINKYKKSDEIDGAILGCTELPLLISQKDVEKDIVIFDTLQILAQAVFSESIN